MVVLIFVLENLQPHRASFDKNHITRKKVITSHVVLNKLTPIKKSNPSEKIASAVSDKSKAKSKSKIQRSNNKQVAILLFVKNSVWNGFL